ncbi:hypothetical protein Glove_209g148 [Diversispora epigaea]|uniref:Guanine deaminase n=1 Tax=Diversispora epigaea TaxID=1348612 RepID=A0A397IIT2_9GLOM|nr:hypothetical protein Glove_209g148 [Diversispora epigaea]
MMTRIISQIFYGTLIHSLSLTKLSIIPNALLGIDKFGKIAFVEENITNEQNINDILSKWNINEEKIIRLTKRQFLIPGFVDTHIHAPQFPNAGTGLDLPLLEWLNKYTFPLEKSYSSLEFAKNVYPVVINNLLRNGTTTAVYFSTIHLESSKYLAKLIHEKGQRGFLGKVNMDRNCPNDYIETIESSIEDTKNFVEYVMNLDEKDMKDVKGDEESITNQVTRLVTPIITPRFAISCSSELLHSLSKLAQEYDLPIQSHLSENKDEIKFVKNLFPNLKDYTSVYEHHNLLNQKTIMAHGIYLSSDERNLIKNLKVGISHCPNSNFSLSSGICDVRKLLNDNIKVGLGTDISGGFGKSILDSIRNASVASKVIHFSNQNDDRDNNNKNSHLTLPELFYLSTMGGANLVNLENVIGNFEVGKEFDALLIDPESPQSPIDIFDYDDDNIERIFEKFIFLGDERNISRVYVQGNFVSGTEFK